MTLTSPGRGENTKGQGNREQVDGFNEKEQQLYNFGTSISIGWHKKTHMHTKYHNTSYFIKTGIIQGSSELSITAFLHHLSSLVQ